MLAELVDLVLPRSCVGCARDGVALCPDCAVVDVQQTDVSGLRVTAAARYESGVRSALLAYKERGRRDLAVPLGLLLGAALGDLSTDVVLVPVPSSAAARRERGGDHVHRLARVAARRLHVPIVPALALTRRVRDSAGLDIATRAANLDHAMAAVRAPVRAVPVVLVDDITTTGATLHEAARALRAAGWPVQCAAVVAATPLRLRGAQRLHESRMADTSGTPGRAGLT